MNQTLSIHLAIHFKIKDLLQRGLCREALNHFRETLQQSPAATYEAVSPILPSLIKASSSLPHLAAASQLHCFAIKTASDTQVVVSNSLLSSYFKLASVQSARYLFDTMPHRDAISWNAMIMGFIQNGLFSEALLLFMKMSLNGYFLKPQLIASVLSICSRIRGGLKLGREIHGFVVGSGIMVSDSVFLSTALVDLYMQGGDLSLAFRVFDQMKMRNEVSWTAVIGGCVDNHEYETALLCFRTMQHHGIRPNRVTLISIVPVCSRLGLRRQGMEIYGYAFRHGFHSDLNFSAALIHMFGLFGQESVTARKIMSHTKERDVVVWSSVIDSFSRDGKIEEAFRHFNRMRSEGIEPNFIVLLAILSACTNRASVGRGGSVHSYTQKSGFLTHVSVGNSLLNMYAKCGSLHDARQVFEELPVRDTVSWSCLISAYGLVGNGNKALETFNEMKGGTEVDSVTLLSTLSACSRAGLVEEGQKLFEDANKEMIQLSLEHYSCQIDLLGRSGRLKEACELIRQMPLKPDNKIWSSIVSACMDHGRPEIALKLANELIQLEPGNAAHYTLLSNVYAESGDWVKAEAVRWLMRESRLKKSHGFSKVDIQNVVF